MTRAQAESALLDTATAAGLAVGLAFAPRRVTPIVGLAGAIILSRAHGYALHRLEDTVARLFDERESVGRRVTTLEERIDRLAEGQRINAEHMDRVASELEERVEGRLGDLELLNAGYNSGVPADALELVDEARARALARVADALERRDAPVDLEQRRRRRDSDR